MAIYKKAEELWITNVSRVQDIRVADLGITVRRGQSLNLLSKKKNGLPRFPCTKEMIEKSRKDGSIFKKSHVIKVREVAPVVFNSQIEIVGSVDRNNTRLKRKPTDIEIPEYPDLDLDETSLEDYAAENADMDFADRAPALPVDPLYKKPTVDDE
jgi:hypothetical protein